jgi:hypothetical protein
MLLVYVRVCTVRKWLLMEKGRNLSFSSRRNDSFFVKLFLQCTVLHKREKHRSYLHSWYSDTSPWAQLLPQYIDLRSWGWWGWWGWVAGGWPTIRPPDAGFRTIGSIKIAASSHQCILKSWKGPPFLNDSWVAPEDASRFLGAPDAGKSSIMARPLRRYSEISLIAGAT